MVSPSFSARYTAAMAECGGHGPIEAGVLGRLADHECRHGRLPFDRTPACGCWPQEGQRFSRCLAGGGCPARVGALHEAADR
jgi:hypothetical protein